MHYLRYLAARGRDCIHPGGALATGLLLRALRAAPGNRLLEVGCGTGGTVLRAAALPAVDIVGIDAMAEMLAAAAQRLQKAQPPPRAALVAADARSLPFADGSFDRAYAESVFGMQDADSIVRMLRELRRVLRPDARFVMNDAIWKSGTGAAEIAEANRLCVQAFGLRQASREPWRLDDWRRALQDAGFEVIDDTLIDQQLDRWLATGQPGWHRRMRRILSRLRLWALHRWLPAWTPGLRYGQELFRLRHLGAMIESRLFIMRVAAAVTDGSAPRHHDQEVIADRP
jgi:ubiquinone/menaquinone biosynthesis C-methylase UbiE